MADSTESRALLLQINATTELLRSQLSAAEQATAHFQATTQAHLDKTDARFEALGNSIEKPLEQLKRLGEFTIGALLGESLLEAGKKGLEFAGNVQFVSEQVGVSTDFLQKYRYAAGQFGVATQSADEGLGKFARSVGQAANGNKTIIDLFDRLGVKVRDAAGQVRSVESVFLDTSTAIAKLPDPAQKTADTMQLMGRQSAALVPLLSEGAEGFNTLAAAAQQLGVVLSPELIAHSEEVNHKLAALKQVVDAQMSSAIAQNATAIEGLATAVVKVAGAFAQLTGTHPERALAILGGLVGLKLGGAAGLVIGAGAGYVAGDIYGAENEESSNDIALRRQKLKEAHARYNADLAAKSSGYGIPGLITVHSDKQGSPDDTQAAAGALSIEIARMQRALLAPRGEAHSFGSAGAGATNDNGDAAGKLTEEIAGIEKLKVGKSGAVLAAYNTELAEKQRELSFIKQGATAEMAKSLASKEGSAISKGENDAKRAARKAEEDRLRALSEQIAFEGQVRQAEQGLAKAKVALSDTAEGQLSVELQSLQDAQRTRVDQLRLEVLSGKRTQAQADQLLVIYRETEADDEILANRKEQARLIAERTARESLEVQGAIDALGIQDRLALTRKERLAIELRLLDLQEQLAKKAQQEIIDSPTSTAEQRTQAATRITQIDAQHPGNVALVQRQNESPLDAYKTQLKGAVGDVNDAIEGVKVDAFKGLEDGIVGVISGTESVASAFKKMAESIIADLLRIEIERTILGAIDGGASGGGGGIGGFLSGLLGHADGGPISGPGTGTSDSILARLSAGEFVINAASAKDHLPLLMAINDNRLPRFADGGPVMPSLSAPRLPNLGAAGGGRSGTTIVQNFDNRGALIDRDVYADMHRIAASHAQQAAIVGTQVIAGQLRQSGRATLPGVS